MARKVKVIVTGDSCAGKSQVITQFINGRFVEGYGPRVSEPNLEKGFPPCLTQTKLISHIR